MKKILKGSMLVLCLGLFFSTSVQAQKTTITSQELPANASTFLKKHYPKVEASSIIREKEAFSTEFEVKLSNGVEIEFDKNGNWKEIDGKGQEIHSSLLLPETKSYLAKNYAGQKVVKIERGLNIIEVELSSGIEIKFDKKGYFVKVD